MTDRRPFVLGLSGRAGVGKSTVAAALREAAPPCAIHGVALPLKSMLRTFLIAAGVAPADAGRMVDGDLKEVPAEALAGRTPRYAMQTLGTEWGRDLIAADLWVRAWSQSADRHLATGWSVINDTVRFPNEVAAIRAAGGLVVRLTGRAGPEVGAHVSESLTDCDLEVPNVGPPESAAAAILDAFDRWRATAGA